MKNKQNRKTKTPIILLILIIILIINTYNVKAHIIEDQFENINNQNIQETPQKTTTINLKDTIGQQNTALILIKKNIEPPMTNTQAHKLIFHKKINDFYKQTSNQKTWLKGDTYGWYESTMQCKNKPGMGMHTGEIIAQTDNNINYAKYDRIIVLYTGDCIQDTWGASTIGKQKYQTNDGEVELSWSAVNIGPQYNQIIPTPTGNPNLDEWTWLEQSVAHEIGHAFGLGHANYLDCHTETNYKNCENINYGNYNDIMGKGRAGREFNTINKEKLGWIENNQMQTITQEGIYKLQTISSNENSKSYKLKTQHSPTEIYLEYRQPKGYDKSMTDPQTIQSTKGIFILKNKKSYTQLLDATPNSKPNNQEDSYDASLLKGQTYYDKYDTGIKITNIHTQNNDAYIYVQFKEAICEQEKHTTRWSGAGTLILTPNTQTNLTIITTNKNTASCGETEYELNPTQTPKGIIMQKDTTKIHGQESKSQKAIITTTKYAKPGRNNITIEIQNKQNKETTKITIPILIQITPETCQDNIDNDNNQYIDEADKECEINIQKNKNTYYTEEEITLTITPQDEEFGTGENRISICNTAGIENNKCKEKAVAPACEEIDINKDKKFNCKYTLPKTAGTYKYWILLGEHQKHINIEVKETGPKKTNQTKKNLIHTKIQIDEKTNTKITTKTYTK